MAFKREARTLSEERRRREGPWMRERKERGY